MRLPLDLRFKKIALAPQISVRDAAGQLVLYVRQKAFKLKESVTVFGDEAQSRALYRIDADRIVDFSARYRITDVDGDGRELGTVQRRGMRSIWRAHYEVQRDGVTIMEVREENPWIRVLDGLMSDIPVVGLFTGYAFIPTYRLTAVGGDGDCALLRMRKRPSFFESRFEIERPASPAGSPLTDDEERLGVLGLLMIVLLERHRG